MTLPSQLTPQCQRRNQGNYIASTLDQWTSVTNHYIRNGEVQLRIIYNDVCISGTPETPHSPAQLVRSQLHLQQHWFDLKSVLQCTTSRLSNLFQQDPTQWRHSADQYRKRHGASHYKPHAKAFVFSSIREIRDSMYAKMNCGRGNPRSQTIVTSGNSSRNGVLTV